MRVEESGEGASMLSSPNSTAYSFQMEDLAGGVGVVAAGTVVDAKAGREWSRGSDMEENGEPRKKLRLSKEQSAFLEKSFKEHKTLKESPKVTAAEERVHMAVGKEVKEGKNTLLWALQNFHAPIVITHVHRPATLIPFLGGKFPVSQLQEQEVRAYRQLEEEKMNKTIDEFLSLCSQQKVKANKLVIKVDDVARGLVELIAQYGITKLVMGAAADKYYSKKMKLLRSKTATTVKQLADPSCHIWFVCKGNLICTRDCISFGLAPSQMCSTISQSSSSSISSSQSEQLRSRSSSEGKGGTLKHMQNLLWRRSSSQNRANSENSSSQGCRALSDTPQSSPIQASSPLSMLGMEGSLAGYTCEEKLSKRTLPTSYPLSQSENDEVLRKSDFQSLSREEESEVGSGVPPVDVSDEDLNFLSPHNELEDVGVDVELYHKLQDALTEAGNLKREAYKESLKRQRAEMDAFEAFRRAKVSEKLFAKEIKLRKEIEEALDREKLELEMLKNQQDELSEELQKVCKEKLELESRITNSDNCIKDLEEKLSAAKHLLSSLQEEHDLLQKERDEAVREAKELHQKKVEKPSKIHEYAHLSEFSFSEIEQATHSFSHSLKIGEGGYGAVYKGILRNTTVAIKIMNPDGLQGRLEFDQEVDVLSRVRHPNLVTLIGACPDVLALIYEYLPNGSLEDRLACTSNSQPLNWQARTRIAAEICSALIFLHSSKPHPVVHGDLKPQNILLDASLVSKLSDFGLCRYIVQSEATTTLYRHTHPKGTFVYMDPEFLATGELTPRSDVYSFGVIILRLLTGRRALGIVKEVQDAIEKEALHGVIDPTAGDWPFVQAMQLAHLGLRCCKMNRKNRPDLTGEVWRVLEPMMKPASFSSSQISFSSFTEDNAHIPNYFICPIFQEVMRDPHIAADGFTYEAEALRGWIHSGHSTSPMTNLKLSHCELTPNRALRSAIQEWMQQQQLRQF